MNAKAWGGQNAFNTRFLFSIAQTCLVETVHLDRPSSAPKSKSASVHNSEALPNKPSNVRSHRVSPHNAQLSFKHLQQSRTSRQSAPPLPHEFLHGRPATTTPDLTFSPSCYHKEVAPRKLQNRCSCNPPSLVFTCHSSLFSMICAPPCSPSTPP